MQFSHWEMERAGQQVCFLLQFHQIHPSRHPPHLYISLLLTKSLLYSFSIYVHFKVLFPSLHPFSLVWNSNPEGQVFEFPRCAYFWSRHRNANVITQMTMFVCAVWYKNSFGLWGIFAALRDSCMPWLPKKAVHPVATSISNIHSVPLVYTKTAKVSALLISWSSC